MSIFDRFKPKSGVPHGPVEVNVQFTADENEAMNRAIERYATAANASAPEGMQMFVAPKVKDGIAAQGLAEYVEHLLRQGEDCGSDAKIATMMDKAIKGQMKAYALHSLPIYLFQLAELFELAGNATKAREFFQHFLRAQDAFKPDQIDNLLLNQMGLDLAKVVEAAKQRVAETEPNLIEKADQIGEGLVSGATEVAGSILEGLGKFEDSLELRQENSTRQFVIEVIVFYMHLVDRLAFAHLGAAKRNVFLDRVTITVLKMALQALSKDGSAEDLGKALRDTYSRRQIEYGCYKVLIAEKDEPLRDTLYWEFSKVLLSFVDDSNPATLTFLNLIVADMTKAFMDDTLRVGEVLLSLAQPRTGYDDPAEQIMFILSFKHDPKYDTILDAIEHGSNPGIVDALDQLPVYSAIYANLSIWAKMVETIGDESGAGVPAKLKDEVYRMIVEELDAKHYGGKWFHNTRIPSDGWINMGSYSPLFVRGNAVFCLPVPYFRLLASIL